MTTSISTDSFSANPATLPLEVQRILLGEGPAPTYIETVHADEPTHFSDGFPNRETRATSFIQKLERDEYIYHQYIEGVSVTEIARETGLDYTVITRSLEKRRRQLLEHSTINLLDEVEDRVAALNIIKRQAEQYMTNDPGKAPQFLKVKLDAEKQIAALRGLDQKTINHTGKIQHEVKTYDFVDTLPPAIIDGSGHYIEDNNA